MYALLKGIDITLCQLMTVAAMIRPVAAMVVAVVAAMAVAAMIEQTKAKCIICNKIQPQESKLLNTIQCILK